MALRFNEPNVHFFSFNNPYGACPECEGYGKVIGIDEDLVIPNKKFIRFRRCSRLLARRNNERMEKRFH